jgi:hypothetical protein
MGGTRKVAGTAADRSQQCKERQKKERWKMTDPGVNNSTEKPHRIIILAHDPISKATVSAGKTPRQRRPQIPITKLNLKPLWSLNFLIQALQSHMAKFNTN